MSQEEAEHCDLSEEDFDDETENQMYEMFRKEMEAKHSQSESKRPSSSPSSRSVSKPKKRRRTTERAEDSDTDVDEYLDQLRSGNISKAEQKKIMAALKYLGEIPDDSGDE